MWSPRKPVAELSIIGIGEDRRRPDAVSLLTVYLFLIVCIPSRLVFAPLGAAGTPAALIGLMAFAWWVFYEIQRTTVDPVGAQPVRMMFILLACALFASYVAAMTRPIDASESSTADFGIVTTAAWGGVLLLAHDGITSIDRLHVLLRRLTLAGGAIATLGVVQFITGQAFVDRIEIPGLKENVTIMGVAARSGFNRPAGTALHPIEFGSVIAMILPIALTLALNDKSRSFARRWYPVAAIAMATVMSISRSALIASLLAILLLAAAWTAKRRLGAAGIMTMFGGIVFLTVPGLIGSLLALFTGIGEDSSAHSRSGSYGLASEFIARAPIFGRGLFTFLPRYRILDNQYLLLIIEVGVVGLLAFLVLIVCALWCARSVRLNTRDPGDREMGQALFAAIAAGAAGLALFDGFSFPMSAGLFFLLLGLAGSMWRLERVRLSGDERA